jgi:predicted DNA-binding mobile mystery protein A
MKPQYRELRLSQLAETLKAFEGAKREVRPNRGWLRAIREALGMTLEQVGRKMRVTRQQILAFEHAEAENRITLRSLSQVAEALGCELVYAIVPKSGTITELAEQPARSEARKRILAVEHTMSLEDQAAGKVDERIEKT